MSLDNKLPKDIEKLKGLTEKTDNPEIKREIENRLKTVQRDQTVHK
jgi:hypothetical protein